MAYFDKASVDSLLKMFEPSERYILDTNIIFPHLESKLWYPENKQDFSLEYYTKMLAEESAYLLYLTGIAEKITGLPKAEEIKWNSLDRAIFVCEPLIRRKEPLKGAPFELKLMHDGIHPIKDIYYFFCEMTIDDAIRADVIGGINAKHKRTKVKK